MLINLPCLYILKLTKEKASWKVSAEAHLLMFFVGICTVICFLSHCNIYGGCYKVA